mmetsp:Transcript_28004/g.63378  ORF Transcript_28004/g.63378 Transcript_28004/m.63378 type:complete len:357 (-) Transcript_28004:97-1167(-)
MSHAQVHGNLSRSVRWDRYISLLSRDGDVPVFAPPDTSVRSRIGGLGPGGSSAFIAEWESSVKSRDAGTPFEWEHSLDWLALWPDLGPFSDIMGPLAAVINCAGIALPTGTPVLPLINVTGRLGRPGQQPEADNGARAALGGMSQLGFVELDASATVRDAAATVLRSTSLQPRGFATLHVRRGDALGFCNTSIAAVAAYVACSLGSADQLASGSNRTGGLAYRSAVGALVFFTDESDQNYLDELNAALSLVVGHVIHGDAAVYAAGGHADGPMGNPFVFAVSLQIRAQAALDLRVDRTNCSPCDAMAVATPARSFGDAVLAEQFGVTEAADSFSHLTTPWHDPRHDMADPSCTEKS